MMRYAIGWNRWGEIGNGTQEEQRFPIKLELNNKFIDIASHYYYPISMSQSIDGIYYVWGKFEDKGVLSPQSTKYESFENILSPNNFIKNINTQSSELCFPKRIAYMCPRSLSKRFFRVL